MNSIYDYRQRLKFIFVFVAVLIAIASVVVSDLLIKDFAQEERQKIEVWAEATRVITSEDPSLNMSFVLKIIMGNTSIPVVLCDDQGEVIESRNIDIPEKEIKQFWEKKVKLLKSKNPPIAIDLGDGTFHYVYYDDSFILKKLLVYPYAQLTVVFVFILIAFLALANLKRAEQNKVWVGLSKETAHQLGTPISSLIAWIEYFRMKEIDPALLTEMEKDVKRLETIAERFSKIGSNPELLPIDINASLKSALVYMETRISSKVRITPNYTEEPLFTSMNESLFAWVIENLLKNAVDAMEGQGDVSFTVEDRGKRIRVEIADSGKGIPKSKFKTIFTPGYTTKERGWGLGLSLVRRIVESYHRGKIFVKSSELGKGTVFCLELPKYGK